jgi:hypothetical protein
VNTRIIDFLSFARLGNRWFACTARNARPASLFKLTLTIVKERLQGEMTGERAGIVPRPRQNRRRESEVTAHRG